MPGLQALHEKFERDGLTVLGFPCNQFGRQELGTRKRDRAFCREELRRHLSHVRQDQREGPEAHPLFQYLTQAKPGILGTEAIKWNFTKFLVDRDGDPVARYAPQTKPEELEKPIEKYLSS